MPVGVMARVATCMRGPGTSPFCDGFFHVDVGVHGAFGFEVTNRGEAVFKSNARVARAEDSAVRNGILQKLLVIVLRGDVAVEKNVGVRINEAGEDGGFGQVEHFGACRRRGVGRDGDNGVALNEDDHVVETLFTSTVNQMTGSNGDGLLRSRRSCLLFGA